MKAKQYFSTNFIFPQGTPISENSPIKTELETILSAQVQRTSREVKLH